MGGATQPSPSSAEPTLAGRTVLVVEDHADSRELLRQVLRALRARVVTAPNIRDAEERLRTRQPDLIVCDMKLPDGTGLDFVHWLRAMPAKSGGTTPCIAITGYGQYFPPARVGSSFDAYLQKPIDLDEFCDLAMELTGRHDRPGPK